MYRNDRQAEIKFLLTHLMRGVTTTPEGITITKYISTHTPHARCDETTTGTDRLSGNFYSHTSCEV